MEYIVSIALVIFLVWGLVRLTNFVDWLKSFPISPDGHPSGKIMPGLAILVVIVTAIVIPLAILLR
jgi:hypothetical protein